MQEGRNGIELLVCELFEKLLEECFGHSLLYFSVERFEKIDLDNMIDYTKIAIPAIELVLCLHSISFLNYKILNNGDNRITVKKIIYEKIITNQLKNIFPKLNRKDIGNIINHRLLYYKCESKADLKNKFLNLCNIELNLLDLKEVPLLVDVDIFSITPVKILDDEFLNNEMLDKLFQSLGNFYK